MTRRALPALALLAACSSATPPPAPIVVDATEPALTVSLPALQLQAALFPAGKSGPVASLVSTTDLGFSFRGGMLVATRGLGFDLMAADVTGALAALGRGGDYSRHYRWLDSANHAVIERFACTMGPPLPAPVGALQHEVCQNDAGLTFANSYLIAGGRIVAAQEWIGPELGQAAFSQP